MNVLFITWDGPQVFYLETLFLPIFQELGKKGIYFHVLQFTWGNDEILKKKHSLCDSLGIPYRQVNIWRRPLAAGSLLTSMKGAIDIRSAIKDFGIDVLMPRSTLPALSTLLALRGHDMPVVFDADGLPLDERVDFAGQSPTSLVYRLLRDVESQAIRRANTVLTRSSKASDILLSRAGAGTDAAKFHVVSNGRDPSLFTPSDDAARLATRRALGVATDAPLLVYAGSMGPQYCPGEMLGLFARVLARRPDARMLVLTSAPQALEDALSASSVPGDALIVKSVAASDVPAYLACADAGLALRRPSFSMQAVAPIKLGEYLLCGLPVIATQGIGDTDFIHAHAGFLTTQMDEAELHAAADWLVDTVLPQRETFRKECREVGMARFSLAASIQAYMGALLPLLKDERGISPMKAQLGKDHIS